MGRIGYAHRTKEGPTFPFQELRDRLSLLPADLRQLVLLSMRFEFRIAPDNPEELDLVEQPSYLQIPNILRAQEAAQAVKKVDDDAAERMQTAFAEIGSVLGLRHRIFLTNVDGFREFIERQREVPTNPEYTGLLKHLRKYLTLFEVDEERLDDLSEEYNHIAELHREYLGLEEKEVGEVNIVRALRAAESSLKPMINTRQQLGAHVYIATDWSAFDSEDEPNLLMSGDESQITKMFMKIIACLVARTEKGVVSIRVVEKKVSKKESNVEVSIFEPGEPWSHEEIERVYLNLNDKELGTNIHLAAAIKILITHSGQYEIKPIKNLDKNPKSAALLEPEISYDTEFRNR